MQLDKLETAMTMARRFLDCARAVEAESEFQKDGRRFFYLKSGKTSAACKRASMELTRSLARLRKPEEKL